MNEKSRKLLIGKLADIDKQIGDLTSRRQGLVWPILDDMFDTMRTDPRTGRYLSMAHITVKSGGWDCLTSPTQYCIYNDLDDTAHDHCLFCRNPEERK